MHIHGVDFTSAPGPRKPLTLVSCHLRGDTLSVQGCQRLPTLLAFENFLRLPGPWLAALDFPFGLPRKLLLNLGWPLAWSAYVQLVADLGKTAFEQTLTDYRGARPAGDKHHLRAADRLAGACSPMMLHRVPVAKMFFQGATRLLASEINLPPVRVTSDQRSALEGYPALVARTFLGRQGYKSDERARQTPEQLLVRQHLLDALCSPALKGTYGMHLNLPSELRRLLVADPQGDCLDALLCAIQASWAFRRPGWGVPEDCDQAEGWIADPHMLEH